MYKNTDRSDDNFSDNKYVPLNKYNEFFINKIYVWYTALVKNYT